MSAYIVDDWVLIEQKIVRVCHRISTGEPSGYYLIKYYHSNSSGLYKQEREFIHGEANLARM